MRSILLWLLVIANVLLLADLVGRFTRDNVAAAQAQPAQRVGDYLMVPMEQSSGEAGLVAIIDQNTGRMAAVAYNGRNGMDVMSAINLEQPSGAGGGNTGRGY